LIKNNNKYFKTTDGLSEKTFLLHPYVQTKLFINECISLSMVLSGGNIKLVEPSGARKDRYTAVSYANYFASLLDQELLKDEEENDEEEMLSVTGLW